MGSIDLTKRLLDIYEILISAYGIQRWWPANSPFEVMVGAILTQAASWENAKKAIDRLESAGVLSPEAIRVIPEQELAQLVYSAGYYNAKARKLKALANHIYQKYDGDVKAMKGRDVSVIRGELLDVYGIGEETVDDILLYALDKPVFVIDEYTRRIFVRLGLSPRKSRYSDWQAFFMSGLSLSSELYAEYHALIVWHGKSVCKKRPLCDGCCLLEMCPVGRETVRYTNADKDCHDALVDRPKQ